MKNLILQITASQFIEKSRRHPPGIYLGLKLISFALIIAILNLTGGCMNYFMVTQVKSPVEENIDNFNSLGKKIIIHLENRAWILEDPSVSEGTLTGSISEKYVSAYTKPINPKGANRYRKNNNYDESYILKEVHVYVSEYTQLPDLKISVPLTAIKKIDLYEKDKAATTASWIIGYLFGASIVMATIFIIVLLTKDSCPFIYTFDGENYKLAGEIYSGSIQPGLERHDFLKLPVYGKNDPEYKLRIANEVKEIQRTNLMELWIFDHKSSNSVWVDKYGKYHTATSLTTPSKATSFSGQDVLNLVTNRDSLFYSCSETSGELPLTDGIVLEFPNPKTSDAAKLIIKAKNSFLADYMIGQFHNLFGDAYSKWTKMQQKVPGEQLRKWALDQNIPLSLSVERNGKWEPVDYYNVAGPMAMKEDILQISLIGNESDPLKVKLESGNFFWEIDYTGIDFSTDAKINYQVIPVSTAINDAGNDVRKLLTSDDNKYYIQPVIGNSATVTFKLPPISDDERSIILHSKGWYQILKNPSGKPDREYLETFRQPGCFNRFVNDYVQAIAEKTGINK